MSSLPIPPAHARELAALRSHRPELRVVVIGAAAVGCHVPLDRSTRDVDLAIAIAPSEVAAIVEPLGWRRDPRISIRWHGPHDFRADIIPASGELSAASVLELDGGDRAMSLLGLDLALTHANDVALADGPETIPVASVPALTVLKMVSWLDRPTERTRDLGDLAALLDGALASDDPLRWDQAHPLWAAELSHDRQSPYFVGLGVGAIVGERHVETIDRFLHELLAENGRWSAAMARAAGHPASDGDERVRAMLETFRCGLEAVQLSV